MLFRDGVDTLTKAIVLIATLFSATTLWMAILAETRL